MDLKIVSPLLGDNIKHEFRFGLRDFFEIVFSLLLPFSMFSIQRGRIGDGVTIANVAGVRTSWVGASASDLVFES